MDDLDIWRSAKVMIDRYGENAQAEAVQRANQRFEEGDVDGAAVWRQIARAITELQNTTPTGPLH